MVEFVTDCPRCGAKHQTHDVFSSVVVRTGLAGRAEISCICRSCHKMSCQAVKARSHDRAILCFDEVFKMNSLCDYKGSLNDLVLFEDFITLKDRKVHDPPEHIPDPIKGVIVEANKCFATGCWNASAAMYRLSLDLATKSLIPDDAKIPAPSFRSLGLRLEWMFSNQILPIELKGLATCIKEDGNDGAHDGTLSKEDAEDLHDFIYRLLERVFSEPERLRLAEMRRLERRRKE